MDADTNKIEQYLNGQLQGSELVEFEERLKEDSNFANEVEMTRTLIKGIQKKGDALDRNFLKSIHQEAKQKGLLEPKPVPVPDKERKVFNLIQFLSIAASLVLAFVAYNYFTGSSSTTEQNPLAFGKETRANMVREIKASVGENLGFADGDDDEALKKKQVDSLLNSAWIYVADRSDYELAIPIFKEVLTLDSLEKRAIHGLAESNFQKGDYKKAMELMKDLVQDTNYDWINDVRFRYAQCLQVLNIGSNASIIKWYQLIINDPSGSSDLQVLAQQYIELLQ